jgi:N-sulfoglucosamine sulfohydrolase
MFREFPTTYSILQGAGYTTGLIGKTHVNPEAVVEPYVDYRAIPSANFAKEDLDAYARHAAAFMASAADKPFFLTVNYPDTHWPFQDQVDGRPERPLTPDEVSTMPFVGFENARTRQYATSYYNCLQRLDWCVGELLRVLAQSGRADNTLVIYIGDHGPQMARGKIWPLEAGVKVPYLVRWPDGTAAGTRRRELVSTVDFLPTFLDAAGIPPRPDLPGRSILPLLTGEKCEFRRFLAVERNSDVAFIHFPQRAVRDERYKLIWSPLRDRPDPGVECCLGHTNPAYCGCPSTQELAEAPPHVQAAYATWLNPPEYQLYDLATDPYEFVDLAGQPMYATAEKRMKQALNDWMRETDDWIRDPEKLAKLTAENDAVPPPGHGAPNGGWQYHTYLQR